MYTINTIFPKSVLFADTLYVPSEEEYAYVTSQEADVYSNYGNTTSNNTDVLSHPSLTKLRAFIQEGISAYVSIVIAPKQNHDFYITQSWLNYTKPGESHHSHTHMNSIISGVFYFNAEETDNITFFSGEYKRIYIESNWNQFNCDASTFPVKTGNLVLFDSCLSHRVDSTISKNTRVSLAFNVFVRGNIGTSEGLTLLHL